MNKETTTCINVARIGKREQLDEVERVDKGGIEDKFSKMSYEVAGICKKLTDKKDSIGNGAYEKEIILDIVNYIKSYDRILYSEISNCIFGLYDKNIPPEVTEEKIGNMQTNISKVVEYAYSDEYSKSIEKMHEEQKTLHVKVKSIALKIQDHINLAQQQCNSLKQTDEEYREKFERNIADFKENLTKEMNGQLITLVSIFTALAFLLFGGISSLDNIFSDIKTASILKLIMVGCIWGICLVNLIFVFLYCISKMTKLSFALTNSSDGTIFQRYPIFWWTNYIIISIFGVAVFFYFLAANGDLDWLLKKSRSTPGFIFFVGSGAIFALIMLMSGILVKKCKSNLQQNELENR